jgi:hypothetical protein
VTNLYYVFFSKKTKGEYNGDGSASYVQEYSVEPLMRTTLPRLPGAMTTAACGCNHVAGVPEFFADWLINAQQSLHQTTATVWQSAIKKITENLVASSPHGMVKDEDWW